MASPNPYTGAAPDPRALMEMHFSFAPSYILNAGVRLDVFSHIAEGKNTPAEVARAAGATERGIRMLLDALAGQQLLAKNNGHYELTPLAAEYLVRGRPNYAGSVLEHDAILEPWSRLPDVIRTGKPPHGVEIQKVAEEFFPTLVRTLHVVHRPQAKRLAEALGVARTHDRLQVIDIACGSGVWGIGIAEATPQARITAQDYPAMLDITREYAAKHGVGDRYSYLPGDLKEVDLGEGRFDLALLGHIVHSEGEESSRSLFRRLHRALKTGGRIAIMEMIPNDDRSGPPFPLIFALNMLVHTNEGDTYTLSEYRKWLNEAGFDRVETAEIGGHSPAIIATRP